VAVPTGEQAPPWPTITPTIAEVQDTPTPLPKPVALVYPTVSPTVDTQAMVHQLALDLLEKMTLEQKAGQVFMLGLEGTSLNEVSRTLVHDFHLGGVVLFARNVETPDQTAGLIHDLQALADPVPLFISADQEGGLVERITTGATVFPGNMALGATGDPSLARRTGEITADELRAIGINMNLAPVLDLNTNRFNPVTGVRTFGSEARSVAEFGAEMITGLQSSGVSAVAKHFPGHGDTAVDSHRDLPVIVHPLPHLEQNELIPFRAAIQAGVDGIMTAHLYLPALERQTNLPATLSRTVLTGLLREKLGYEGLILTDALDMEAILRDRTIPEAAIQALLAGADLLLVSGLRAADRIHPGAAPKALAAAVRSGRVSQARLDQSVLRILETKIRRGIIPSGFPAPKPPGLAAVGSADHQAVALEVARRSITLLRDEAQMLPLSPDRHYLVVYPNYPTRSLVEERGQAGNLAEAVRQFAPTAEEWRVEGVPLTRTIAMAAQRARTVDMVILGTYNLSLEPAQKALARALLSAGQPVVAIALRGPYDAASMPQIPTFLAAYSDRPVSVQAAAEVLFGRVQPVGQVPVKIP
jgi:beta-N-acetylhexosaminidase